MSDLQLNDDNDDDNDSLGSLGSFFYAFSFSVSHAHTHTHPFSEHETPRDPIGVEVVYVNKQNYLLCLLIGCVQYFVLKVSRDMLRDS